MDSSVLVALLSEGSTWHQATYEPLDRLRSADVAFVLAEHVILETFSVLSRSPKPLGLPPRTAERLLLDFSAHATIAPIRQGLALDTIRHTLDRGHHGGRIYDALIALSVFEAGARLLLTWNPRHFHSIAPVGLEVREP